MNNRQRPRPSSGPGGRTASSSGKPERGERDSRDRSSQAGARRSDAGRPGQARRPGGAERPGQARRADDERQGRARRPDAERQDHRRRADGERPGHRRNADSERQSGERRADEERQRRDRHAGGDRREDADRQQAAARHAGEERPAVSADSDPREEDGDASESYLAGKHPVLEALRAGRALNKIWVSSQAQRQLVQPILEEAKNRGVVVQFADKKKLDTLVPDVQHQGVVAQAAAVSYAEVDDILALAAARGEPPLLVLLDEVEDPHNLGSILRSADCTGVHGVIVPKRRSASLTAVVAKTSAGAALHVPVARVANLSQTIDKLKEAGIWIAGADAAATQTAYRANLTGALALVIGSEGKGISRLVREQCDFLVSLPMFGQVNSLNASVAAGVLLYEAVRQRLSRAGAAAEAGIEGPGEGHASP